MEMVSGGHFENLIRERGKIPELEMLPLAIEVAQGLKAAQAAGLIHRDVKPGNILLDAAGNAKLVDFGLALVTHGGKARATEIWATPYYVPPETVEGHAEDFRSDIYAVGATLYHALSGKPSCGEESMATDVLREAKKKVLPLRTVDASISSATCRLVDRAMAYDPAGRFSSYDELIADLATALDHVISGREDVPAAAGRSRRKWIMPVAVGVALVSAASLALWLVNRPATEPVSIKSQRTAPNPVSEGVDHAEEIARSYRAARAAADAGDFQTAEREFGALHDNPQVQEPTRSWAGVEAVLAAFLDARPADALKQARLVREHLRTLPDSHPLGGREWRALLEGMENLRPLAAPKGKSSASGMIAAMLAGLKNWDQGLLDHAAACFNAVTATKLPQDEGWAAIYQKVAGDYLHDRQILSGPLFAVEPPDQKGCETAIAQLEEALATLKTRGRARFNVRAWQLDLKRRAKLYEAAEAAKPVPPPQNNIPSLDEVLARLAEFAGDWRFSEAAAWLKELPGDPPGASRASLLAIAESATVFLTGIEEDLTREPFIGELPLKTGGAVTRVAIGANGVITATTVAGEVRPCKWSDFSADALIAMHRVLVKKPVGEIERMRRHECAISFDWLAGNRERALAAAAKLSLGSPAFKKRWDSIAAGLPQ
jgi:hypothetical protein